MWIRADVRRSHGARAAAFERDLHRRHGAHRAVSAHVEDEQRGRVEDHDVLHSLAEVKVRTNLQVFGLVPLAHDLDDRLRAARAEDKAADK